MLRAHAVELERLGFHYALTPETSGYAQGVSSGNGLELVRYLDPRRRPAGYSPAEFEAAFDRIYVAPGRTSVISTEFLASADPAQLVRLRQVVLGERPVIVVAAIRNLYAHAFSCWAQLVKRHAHTKPFLDFVCATYSNPQLKALRVYGKVFGLHALRLIPYDAHRTDIVEPFLEAIGAPELEGRLAARINRSLTPAELNLQLALNRVHHRPGVAAAVAEGFVACRPGAETPQDWRPEAAELLHRRFDRAISEFAAKTGLDLEPLLDFPAGERAAPKATRSKSWETSLSEALDARF
jgi:hypothetical protein